MGLQVLPGRYAICSLPRDDARPLWPPMIWRQGLLAVTWTDSEVSVVCPEEDAPSEARTEPGWSLLRVRGSLDLSLTGVLASLAVPLAEAGIPIFAVSTHATDYVLVPATRLAETRVVLEDAGHVLSDV